VGIGSLLAKVKPPQPVALLSQCAPVLVGDVMPQGGIQQAVEAGSSVCDVISVVTEFTVVVGGVSASS
jgi:hypothetical protein